MKHVSGMRGWIELCSDVNWIDYHGMWAKQAKPANADEEGTWYVIKWNNLIDAMGEKGAKEYGASYVAEVRSILFSDIPEHHRARALESCGMHQSQLGIYTESGDILTDDPKVIELVILESLIQYGYGTCEQTFEGNAHPRRIRANARRYAEKLSKR